MSELDPGLYAEGYRSGAREELQEAADTQPVEGGHMLYKKYIARSKNGGHLFVKSHNPHAFTNPVASEHSLEYLYKEHKIYEALRYARYPHIPGQTVMEDSQLIMTAHRHEDGWHWEIPKSSEFQTRYIYDILKALEALEQTPALHLVEFGRRQPLDDLLVDGWHALRAESSRQAVLERLNSFTPDFHEHVHAGVELLSRVLNEPQSAAMLTRAAEKHTSLPRPHIAHLDARASNIAWHPEQGVSIIDWSWASPAPPGCDKTMFIIDMFKSGVDIRPLIREHLDFSHAALLIGFWLARSIEPTLNGDLTVRFHQQASAASAATLLCL